MIELPANLSKEDAKLFQDAHAAGIIIPHNWNAVGKKELRKRIEARRAELKESIKGLDKLLRRFK